MLNIHHKWSLLNIISNGFKALIIFPAEFPKILSDVNITVTFETDIVSAEHYHTGEKTSKVKGNIGINL